ncbi:MAG TPA: hypothetical protein VFV40_08910 [Nocardioides sp.]|nr:hypothetical protein [Nocardioides sp.]
MPTPSGPATQEEYVDHGVSLVRTAERRREIDLLADRLGGRVGLGGVLDDLNREARPTRVPGLAVSWGFRPDEQDSLSRRWWPQGITTSADAACRPDESFAGRQVVLTSAYSRVVGGYGKGARVTVHDVTDPARVRYRHVLLVEPHVDGDGVDLRPLPVHAGGVVWHGDHLHVAGTRRGVVSCRLDDVIRVPAGGAPDRIGIDRDAAHAYGYRYVLPVRFSYEAVVAAREEQLRYSFVSLAHGGAGHQLVAGEYGKGDMTTRLLRFDLDPRTGLLRTEDDVTSRPLALDAGIGHMQGATVVDGRWYVTTSAGPFRLGSVWSGTPGDLRRHRFAMPVGPEDISYRRSTDELWSLSEYPGHRYVFAMDRAVFSD